MGIARTRTRDRQRDENRQAVFNTLLLGAPLARSDIALRTGLTPASVSRITRALIDAGLIEEFERHKTGRPGRQLINLRLKPNGTFVVGVALNAFEQRIAIASLQREIVAEAALPLAEALDPDRAGAVIAASLTQLLRRCGVARRQLVGAAVALAGVVDPDRGIVVRAPTIGWKGVPLGRDLVRRLGLPVAIGTMSQAIARAEQRFGIATDLSDFLVVHATLGIGMCMVVDGRPLAGDHYQAGLVGDLPVQDGASGGANLDAIAGGGAISREWAERRRLASSVSPQSERMLAMIEAVTRGDSGAREICRRGGARLAETAGMLALALGSKAVIVAGPMLAAVDYRDALVSGLHEVIGRRTPPIVLESRLRRVEAACLVAIDDLVATGASLISSARE